MLLTRAVSAGGNEHEVTLTMAFRGGNATGNRMFVCSLWRKKSFGFEKKSTYACLSSETFVRA